MNGSPTITFRERMIAEMHRQKVSMAHLARSAGVSYDVVRDLVRRDGASTSVENAEKIADALGLGVDVHKVENGDPSPDGAPLVPVYDLRASAGNGLAVQEETVAYSLAFPPDYLRRITSTSPRNLTIISVKGDSMEPTLSDDDIVMLDMSKTSLGYEGLFVIRVYDVLHVKRLTHSRPGYIMVISDNRDRYPPREYSVEDVEVVGKVLWAGGKV